MDSEDQEKRSRKNCVKLYRMILNGCDIVLDNEKYFGLSGDNIQCNQRYYTTDPSTTSSNMKFKKKKKYAPKLLVWMAMLSKDTSNIYVHKSKQTITSNIYLNECINSRLPPFIEQHHRNDNFIFCPDNASAHYGNIVLDKLKVHLFLG